MIANVFYFDMGYSKEEIATATKVFGIWMTILGGFLGGVLALRYGTARILMLGAVLTVATNLLFIALAGAPRQRAAALRRHRRRQPHRRPRQRRLHRLPLQPDEPLVYRRAVRHLQLPDDAVFRSCWAVFLGKWWMRSGIRISSWVRR